MQGNAASCKRRQGRWRRCDRLLIWYGGGRRDPAGIRNTVPRNLITDVAGVRVGNAEDAKLASGTTAILFDEPAVAAVDVRGGAPGTRDTDLLDAHRTVERIDAVTLSGGSAFGLDAAAGVQAYL